jgi:hypothetical protein
MKIKIAIILLCFFVCFAGNAQTKEKLKFTSLNQIGVVWGATGDDLQVQTINGVSYKTFSAGLGIGLDYYWERTLPVFIDVRKNIFSEEQTPFVYADFGLSQPWVKTDEENMWQKTKYNRGIYYDIGIGYKAPLYKKISINMSFGYSEKKIREKKHNLTIDDFPPYNENGVEYYDYMLRRFSLKIGFSF